ncbi:MAG: CARDB domain-containing protein [Terrimicrobiaceae bacterium]
MIQRADFVSGGAYHSLGLKFDESLDAWGSNDNGQVSLPASNANFVAVAAGFYHSLGLKGDGTVLAWGSNDNGQAAVPPPSLDPVKGQKRYTAIAAGHYHSMALLNDGIIVACGKNDYGQTNIPAPNSDYIGIAAGASHSVGLKRNGQVVAWGRNDDGQCNVPSPNANFAVVSAGAFHTVALRNDGTLAAWGRNAYGQCNIPAPNADFVGVSAGYYHTIGLKKDGSVVVWGRNIYGVLSVPSPNTGFVAVAAGHYHNVGIKNDGTLVLWGRNDRGQATAPAANTGFTQPEQGQPMMRLSTQEHDFGSHLIGTSADVNVTISNAGGGTLTGQIYPIGSFTVAGSDSYSLAPGASVVRTVRFLPSADGLTQKTIGFSGVDYAWLDVRGTGILPPPEFTSESGSTTVDLNAGEATFTVATTNATSYQWYKGDQPLSDGGRLSGATSSVLKIQTPALDDAGDYWCRATTSGGTADSSVAGLTVQTNRPTATITRSLESANERELITIAGSGTGSYPIVNFQWTYARLDDQGTSGHAALLGTTPTVHTNALPVGSWRIGFCVQDNRNVWSDPVTFDVQIHDVVDFPDLTLSAAETRLVDENGTLVWNPIKGDRVFIETGIQNSGYADCPADEPILLTVFENGNPVSIAKYTLGDFKVDAATTVRPSGPGRSALGAGQSAFLRIPWTVGTDSSGTEITNWYAEGGYPDGPRVLTVQVEFEANRSQAEINQATETSTLLPVAEANFANNQTSFGLFVGVVNGSYAMDVHLSMPTRIYTFQDCVVAGQSNYEWGSFLPVMGAVVEVRINDNPTPTRHGHTSSPEGAFALNLGNLTEGEHTIHVTVFDGRLAGTAQTTVTVEKWTQATSGGYSGYWGGGGGAYLPPIAPLPQPTLSPVDLVVQDIQFSGSGIYQTEAPGVHALINSNLQITATVHNSGDSGTSDAFHVQLKSKQDGLPDVALGAPIEVSGINGHETKTVVINSTWSVPSTHAVEATVDSGSFIPEANEYNNTLSEVLFVDPPLPDLRPYTFLNGVRTEGLLLSTERPVIGQSLVISGEIYNAGTGHLPPGQTFQTTVQISGSKNGLPYVVQYPVDGTNISTGIPAGGKVAFDVHLDAAATAALGEGVNTITITSDAQNAIVELSENNNSLNMPVVFFSQPLWLRNLWFDPVQLKIPNANNRCDLHVEVENIGGEDIGGSVSFYQGSVSPENLIGSVDLDPVGRLGGRGTGLLTWLTPPATEGSHPIVAVLDSDRMTRHLRVSSIPLPNLRILSSDISIIPAPPHRVGAVGETVQVTANVRNQSETPATNVRVEFFLDSPTEFRSLGSVDQESLWNNDGAVPYSAPLTFQANESKYAILVRLSLSETDANPGDNEATTSFTVDLPVAVLSTQLGNGRTHTNQTVLLNGTGSQNASQFQWTLRRKPAESSATLVGGGASNFLTPDVPGTYEIELSVSDGTYTSDPVMVTFDAVEPARLSLSQPTVDFGTVAPATAWERTIQITNTGGETLNGTAQTVAPFAVISGGAYSIQPGASTAVVVRHTAGASGAASGDLVFTGGGGTTVPMSATVGVSSDYSNWATTFGLSDSPPEADHDRDGRSNHDEWVLGLDPVDFSSSLRLAVLGKQGGNVRISLSRVQHGITYLLERDVNFTGHWETVATREFSENQTNVEILDPNPSGQGYYRLSYRQAAEGTLSVPKVASSTVAVRPVSLAGGGAATPVSLPFLREPVGSGSATGISGGNVATNLSLATNTLANTHLLLFVSGPQTGHAFPILSNTSDTVTVNGLPSTEAIGSDFQIVPLHNLNSLFGGVANGGPSLIAGGPSAASADVVFVNGNRYFYKKAGVNAPGWKLESAPNAAGDLGTTTIGHLSGINLIRKGSALTLNVNGLARAGTVPVSVSRGPNLISWPFPRPVTLEDSGISQALQGGATPSAADNIVIGGLRYFYKTSGINSPGWKLESEPDGIGADNVIFNGDGRAFTIIRQTGSAVLTVTE